MSQTVTSTGKTIEQAIRNALKILDKTRDEVDIVVTQEPGGGVFGLFGRKEAIVEVTVKEAPVVIEETVVQEPVVEESPKEEIEEVEKEVVSTPESNEEIAISFLNNLFEEMDIDVEVKAEEDDEFLRINLSGPKMGILIGRRGQTLDAIQYLTSLAVNKNSDDYVRVILDTENYREKRKQTLEDLADKMAAKAVRFGRRVSLEPMNPAERRIIHARLQDNDDVFTYSEGQDPYRRIIIQLNQND